MPSFPTAGTAEAKPAEAAPTSFFNKPSAAPQDQSKKEEEKKAPTLNFGDAAAASATDKKKEPAAAASLKIDTSSTAAAPAAPSGEAKAESEKAAQEAARKKLIEDERIESLLKKWQDQITRNEKDFKQKAQELYEYEAYIFEAIEQIKVIEETSKHVKDVYKTNA